MSLEDCLVVPSLATCTVDILSAGEAYPFINGEQWVYDERGRLSRYVDAPSSPSGTTTLYEWEGECLSRVVRWLGNPAPDPLPDPPVGAIVVEHACDEQGQPVTEVGYEVFDDRQDELYAWTFDNTYDALGQLLSVDVTDGNGFLVTSIQQVWDGQGRVVRRTYPDWDGTGDIDRDFLWDQDRLLGWYEKTDHKDPSLDRIYEGRQLVEERQWNEDVLLRTTTWQHDRAFIGPLSMRVLESGGAFYTRAMAVHCN